MFNPKYTVTPELLANIKEINSLIINLNSKKLPRPVFLSLEKKAREVSSYASNSIEGNPLPLTEVKNILKNTPENIKNTEKEVINYNHILQELDKKLRKDHISLTLKFILYLHQNVVAGLMPKFQTGKLRQEPVVINNPKTGEIIYLPPDYKDVKKLLEELLDYLKNNKGIDPLILAGIFHKQFVLIHPFIDGNGRTARLATKVVLASLGLDTFSLFSFENYYNNNVTLYFQKVGELGNYYDLFKKVDFTSWLEYFTNGIIDELKRVKEEISKTTKLYPPKLQKHALQLLKYLEEKGSISTDEYAELTKRAKSTRTKDFKKLLKLGLIKRKNKGKATYYILP